MAGVKGRSGGARANSGGKRPGAGRKPSPKPPEVPLVSTEPSRVPSDMLEMLQNVALGRVSATTLQVRAAIAAVQYTHTKRHDGGKKEEQASKAKKAAGGRFGVRPPPLKLVNG